jgi:SAM-dependent methyltransferase
MLAQARAYSHGVVWLLGRAEQLPLADDSLDLVFSVDMIHHLRDKAAFYGEAARVLRPAGRVCTVTDSVDIILRREILSGYFPETVGMELARYAPLAQLEAWMAQAQLKALGTAEVEEPFELHSSQPFRDRAYSALHLIPEQAWLSGLQRLERDLERGPVRGASRYACLWGAKR